MTMTCVVHIVFQKFLYIISILIWQIGVKVYYNFFYKNYWLKPESIKTTQFFRTLELLRILKKKSFIFIKVRMSKWTFWFF